MFYSTKARFIEGNLYDSVTLLNDLAEQLEGKIKVAIMNVDDERSKRFASAYGAWPLPCLMYLPTYAKDEEFISEYEGKKNVTEIVEWAL